MTSILITTVASRKRNNNNTFDEDEDEDEDDVASVTMAYQEYAKCWFANQAALVVE